MELKCSRRRILILTKELLIVLNGIEIKAKSTFHNEEETFNRTKWN